MISMNLSSRYKMSALVVFAGLLIFLSWKMSFAKIIDMFNRIKQNEERIQQISDAPIDLIEYQKQMDLPVENNSIKPYDREALFETINTFCLEHNLQILKFHPEQHKDFDGFELIANRIEVQGTFKDMVKLGWFIEHDKRLGNIASATYCTLEDKRIHKTTLSGQFIIQHYMKKS